MRSKWDTARLRLRYAGDVEDDGSYRVRPIGFVRSPFAEKVEAPRQAATAAGVQGSIEVLPAFADAVADLDGFDRIWILFWFHLAERTSLGKVLPPRSETKRGVFATRSPHRPNPIGMSCVRLDRVDGLVVHVRDLDLLDGTPVLDLKPYLAYADAFPDARAGWLEAPLDPRPAFHVTFATGAAAQLDWIAEQSGFDLRARITEALSLGPQPHAYRRIRRLPDGTLVLAVKEWRACFSAEGQSILVDRIASGFRPKDLAMGTGPSHHLHQTFVARFGQGGQPG